MSSGQKGDEESTVVCLQAKGKAFSATSGNSHLCTC